jgi:hypothetical protein
MLLSAELTWADRNNRGKAYYKVLGSVQVTRVISTPRLIKGSIRTESVFITLNRFCWKTLQTPSSVATLTAVIFLRHSISRVAKLRYKSRSYYSIRLSCLYTVIPRRSRHNQQKCKIHKTMGATNNKALKPHLAPRHTHLHLYKVTARQIIC